MKRVLTGMIVAALPIALASCGGDNTPSGGSQNGATSAVSTQTQQTVDTVNSSHANLILARRSSIHSEELTDKPQTTYNVNTTLPCSGGGSVTVTGSLTDTSTGSNPVTINFNYSHTLIFNACVTTGSDGQTYTIGGTGITASGASVWTITNPFQSNQTSISTDTFSITGNFDATGAESLSCDINITEQMNSTMAVGSSTGTGTIAGTACGNSYNGTISYTATSS
jgi:hypothetical protein